LTWKASAETRKTQALEPCIRLASALLALHAVEMVRPERDIVRAPSSTAAVHRLEQDADLRARESV